MVTAFDEPWNLSDEVKAHYLLPYIYKGKVVFKMTNISFAGAVNY